MSDSEDVGPADPVLARLHACVDELFGLRLDSWTDEQILTLWRGLETATRRLSCFDHHMIAQVQSSHRDFVNQASSITVLTRQVLHIGIREAKARISAAEAAGPRRALTGEALPPIYESVPPKPAGRSPPRTPGWSCRRSTRCPTRCRPARHLVDSSTNDVTPQRATRQTSCIPA